MPSVRVPGLRAPRRIGQYQNKALFPCCHAYFFEQCPADGIGQAVMPKNDSGAAGQTGNGAQQFAIAHPFIGK